MRVVTAILCIILVLFAAVQYNDPDALFWAPIYGVGALWAGLAAFRPRVFAAGAVSGLFLVSLVAALAGVYLYWPRIPSWWSRDVWWAAEAAREGMGMMFLALAMLITAVVVVRFRRA